MEALLIATVAVGWASSIGTVWLAAVRMRENTEAVAEHERGARQRFETLLTHERDAKQRFAALACLFSRAPDTDLPPSEGPRA